MQYAAEKSLASAETNPGPAPAADPTPTPDPATALGAATDTERPETARDRLRVVMGDEALARLAASRVMVIGIGGVGSNCAEALARGGVGSLVLVDRDVVAPSNINRQALAFNSTIGQVKVDVMARMVHDINPDCEVETLHAFVPKDGLAQTLGALPRPDFVVDAIDTVSQKLRIAEWCQAEGLPLISSMGGANKLNPERLRFSTIEKTTCDPLCRVMRKECRRRNIRGLRVLYSSEVPLRPEAARAATPGNRPDSSQILGTMSYIPPIMGQMIAGRVICELAGLENPLDDQVPRR